MDGRYLGWTWYTVEGDILPVMLIDEMCFYGILNGFSSRRTGAEGLFRSDIIWSDKVKAGVASNCLYQLSEFSRLLSVGSSEWKNSIVFRNSPEGLKCVERQDGCSYQVRI